MSAPKDLIALLEENLKNGQPLLQDASLYRGTRLPDQTQGSYAKDTMHGSLMLQVAASYTHNWDEGKAFIGSYPIDRESTRFYSDFGLEQKLNGKEVPSYSVKEAEALLEPLVRDLAGARDRSARIRAEERLESTIKRHLYESNVPTKTDAGAANRPSNLYLYTGKPDIAIRQAVSMQMTRVGPENESQAKAVMYREHRNEAIQGIHQLSTQPTAARGALDTIKQVAQREFGASMQREHGAKPLNQMMDDVAKQTLSPNQERMGRFAKALVDALNHPNPAAQEKGQAILQAINKLDPGKASYEDLVKASNTALGKVNAAGTHSDKQVSSQMSSKGKEHEAVLSR